MDFLTYEGEEISTNNDACIYAHKESKIDHLTLRQVDDMEEHVNFPVAKFLLLDDGDYLATVEPKVKGSYGKELCGIPFRTLFFWRFFQKELIKHSL